jgi:hypothetical protein
MSFARTASVRRLRVAAASSWPLACVAAPVSLGGRAVWARYRVAHLAPAARPSTSSVAAAASSRPWLVPLRLLAWRCRAVRGAGGASLTWRRRRAPAPPPWPPLAAGPGICRRACWLGDAVLSGAPVPRRPLGAGGARQYRLRVCHRQLVLACSAAPAGLAMPCCPGRRCRVAHLVPAARASTASVAATSSWPWHAPLCLLAWRCRAVRGAGGASLTWRRRRAPAPPPWPPPAAGPGMCRRACGLGDAVLSGAPVPRRPLGAGGARQHRLRGRHQQLALTCAAAPAGLAMPCCPGRLYRVAHLVPVVSASTISERRLSLSTC